MLLVLLLAACGSSDPAAQRPAARREAPLPPGERDVLESASAPRIDAFTFRPAEPTVADRLSVSVSASDADAVDPLDIDLVWIVNGQRLIDEVAETLGEGIVKKGDEVAVEATASDGENETTERSQTVVVANCPPLFVTDPREIDDLDGFAIVATDPDGDALAWSMEGGPPGLSVDAETGVMEYRGAPSSEGGDFDVVVTVDDGDQGVARWTFAVSVAPGSGVVKGEGESSFEADVPTVPPPPTVTPELQDAVPTHQARDEVREAQARDQVEERTARDEVGEFTPRAEAREATVTDEVGSFEPKDDGR